MKKLFTVYLTEVVKTKSLVEASTPEEAIENAASGEFCQAQGLTIIDHVDSRFGDGLAVEFIKKEN